MTEFPSPELVICLAHFRIFQVGVPDGLAVQLGVEHERLCASRSHTNTPIHGIERAKRICAQPQYTVFEPHEIRHWNLLKTLTAITLNQ